MDEQNPAGGGSAADGTPGPTQGMPQELKQAVSSVGTRLNEDLQALAVHLGNADRMFADWQSRVQEQVSGYRHEFEATQKELRLVQSVVRSLPQQWQAAQQESEAQFKALTGEYEARFDALRQQCDGQLQSFDQRQQADAKTMAGIGEQAATTARTVDDRAGVVAKLETSVVGLIRDINRISSSETAIEELNKKNADLQASIRDLRRDGRTSNRLSLLNSFVAILLAGLVGLQMAGGWPVVANYVALLMPAWMPKPI